MRILEFIKNNLLWIVPIIILVVIGLLYLSRPQVNRNFKPPVSKISVEVIKIQPSRITAEITSYGLVEPRTKSALVAQVSGRVVFVSEKFRDGGFFNKGDKLLSIEKADYEIEVEIARSNLAEAQLALQEEIAQADQAKRDWQRLGNTEDAPSLVLREPQMEAAKAKVRSAKATLRKAELNLSRCEIRAPFDGRVLTKSVDLGQVVGGNSSIAEIYATDAVEIRLPIKNRELQLLNLPEVQNNLSSNELSLPNVEIISELSGREIWKGKIVRTSGSIDSTSRQLYVVARIEEPFGDKAENRFPLKIGQYVTAIIRGKNVESAITIPNRSIYQGSFVYVYQDGGVYRKEIGIRWQNENYALISDGLSPGDILVLTPLGRVNSGTLVKISNAESAGVEVAAAERKTSPKQKGNGKADKMRAPQ